MNLRNVLLCILSTSFLLLASCGNDVAVVNTAKVYQESEAGKQTVAHLTALSQKLQNELVQAENDAQSPEKQNEKMAQLQQKIAAAQQIFNQEQDRVTALLNTKVQKAVIDYREKNNVELIVDHEYTAAYDTKLDITDAIIKELNSTPFDLTVQPSATAPSAPAGTTNATATTNSTAPAK